METDFASFQMAVNMMENGEIIENVEKELIIMHLVINILDNGVMM